MIIIFFCFSFFSQMSIAYKNYDSKIPQISDLNMERLYKIQKVLKENNGTWTADFTSVSNATYSYTTSCWLDNEESFPEEEITYSMVPDKFDWRDVDGDDWTTQIKNQRSCGSCWAFGCLGALESVIKIWNNNPSLNIDLSEQYLLSCSPGSCSGYYIDKTLDWIKQYGIITETCFPYRASSSYPCENKCSYWMDTLIGINGSGRSSSRTNTIQSNLIEYGPLVTHMDVYSDFNYYTGGVYRNYDDDNPIGHSVVIVGYDNTWGDHGDGYWICKNSWGGGWGEDGWFRIAYEESDIGRYTYYYMGLNNIADTPLTTSGPTKGNAGKNYNFCSISNDPDDDKIRYCFDWGDGNQTWSDFIMSGEEICLNYSWARGEKGESRFYDIRVKVKDEHGLETIWSEPFHVTIKTSWIKTQSFNISNPCIFRLIQRFPIIKLLL